MEETQNDGLNLHRLTVCMRFKKVRFELSNEGSNRTFFLSHATQKTPPKKNS